MELDLKAKKNAILFLFIGLLMALINYSFSFSINVNGLKVSIALPVGTTVGFSMILFSAGKLKQCNKTAKYLFIVAILGLILEWASLFRLLINFNDVAALSQQLSQTSFDTYDVGQLIDYLNELFGVMGSLKTPLMISLVVDLICNALPLTAAIFLIGKICFKYNESWNDNKTIKRSIWVSGCYIFMTLGALLGVYLLFDGFGSLHISGNDEQALINFVSEFQSKCSSAILVLFLVGVAAIVFLVFAIKLLIDVYRTYKNLKNDETTSYIEE